MTAKEKNNPEFLAGGGEMGERIRNFNWNANALGNPQHWPQSLKTCVRIMLSSQQPIWIGWGKDLIKLYNDAYIDIVRGKHPFALGQPAAVVWKDIWKDIESLLSKAMEKDEGSYMESQLLIMERSGFPEETYYTFSYTPVLGDNGKPAGIICYNTADTERIINERSLKTLQELDTLAQKKTAQEVYEQAVKALSTNNRDLPFTLLYTISEEGDTATLTSASGFSNDQPELLSPIDLKAPDPHAAYIARTVTENKIIESADNHYWQYLPRGAWDIAPQHIGYIPIKSVSRKFPLAVLVAGFNPYRKLDNAYRNFIQLIADQISLGVHNALAYEEERRRAKELEALNQAKTLFFTNISHEFRTPITLMLGPLEELLHKPSGQLTAAQKQSLELTHRNALRLLRLVNTLLDFSRIESGRQKATFVLTDIAAYTRDIAANFRSVIEKAGLSFAVLAGPVKQTAYIDRHMWEKIVFNLLSNAFKYTLAGSITVRVTEKPGELLMMVEDTGIGIPEKELPYMFDRFHRVENAAGRTYEGTGIGLSLTRELVLLHQGTIAIESILGKGSRFTVSVPAGRDHLPQWELPSHISAPEAGDLSSQIYVEEASFLLAAGEKKPLEKETQQTLPALADTILVVDDNADMRQHISAVLGNNYNIVAAANGREALEKIHQQAPTLILSDIMMPVMDGIALLKEVKANPKTLHIPVVLITARAGEESRVEGFETGADDYLVKPFSANELLARVKAQVRTAKSRIHALEQVKNLFQQAPAAIFILSGRNFVFELVNEQFLAYFNKTREEMIGQRVEDVLPEARQLGFIDIFTYVYNSGERCMTDELPFTYYRKGKKIETFARFVYTPLRDETGTVTGIMVLGDDITQQVMARKKIEENEQMLRTLMETLPQLIWMTDAKGVQQFASGRWLEYSGIEPVSRESWEKIVHPDDLDAINRSWAYSLSTGNRYIVEIRLKSRQGDYRWHYGQGEAIRNSGGTIASWIGSFTDIHDQKIFTEHLESEITQRTHELNEKKLALEHSLAQLEITLSKEKELKLNDEKKDDFILMASHELKTPITTIKGYTQLLMQLFSRGTGLLQQNIELLETALKSMDKQVTNLTNLISELLDLSKIQKGQLELNKTFFSFSDFIGETVHNAQFITQHALQLEISFECMVYADRNRIGQVLLNFITNAVKYSPHANKVNIRVFDYGNHHVAVSVQDYGIGMEENDLEKIFERFYRVEGRKEKTFPGFGIGLFIAKDIIAKHNGSIMVNSRKNSGSLFTFIIPYESGER